MPLPDFHVVCLDPPWPPTYGGAIDQYFALKALTDLGAKPVVHVFYRTDRGLPQPPPPELGLSQVCWYARSVRIDRVVGLRPFIVQSRRLRALYERLRADDRPIWFQGLHCAGWVPCLRRLQSKRRLVLRVHNIEADYYAALAAAESDVKRQLFFRIESFRLRRFEARLWQAFDVLECISQTEAVHLSNQGLPAVWLPAFLASRRELPLPEWLPGELPLLFHADFRVRENELAARFLIDNLPLFPSVCRLTVAGRGLRSWPVPPNCRLVPDPPDMEPLLATHPVVVIPVWRGAGVKLKLLDSIAAGRIVLATEVAVRGSGFEGRVPCFANATELAGCLSQLLVWPDVARREAASNRQYLLQQYNPARLAAQVLADLGLTEPVRERS